MNKPIKQHYIPQFILKNFCFLNDLVKYYNVEKNSIEILSTKKIFMEEKFYNDYNNFDIPEYIEIELGKLESEVARIINNKLLKDDFIKLTKEEDEKLKLFFAIMGFRSLHAKKFFENLSENEKSFYSNYQRDEDFLDLWKRNLGYLVSCRSLDDVINHPNIDNPIKVLMRRDTYGFTGLYFLVFKSSGNEKFVIGDCFPVNIKGDFNITLYDIFPLSPDRMLLLLPYEINVVKEGVLDFTKKELKRSNNSLHFKVRNIYDDKVKIINEKIIMNCKKGYLKVDKLMNQGSKNDSLN